MARIVKLEREPLTRRALAAIREAILSGEYAAGQRLVEGDLASSLEVSRSVVREALNQLEAEGLVRGDDYRGKSIRTFSAVDMLDLLPMRLVLEPLAITAATHRMTEQAAARLRREVGRFSPEIGDFGTYAAIDFNLHRSIWQLSGNTTLAATLERLVGPMVALQGRMLEPLLPELVRREREVLEGSHRGIVEAMCAGDAASARAYMRRHILGFWQVWVAQAIEQDASTDGALRASIQDALDTLASVFDFKLSPAE